MSTKLNKLLVTGLCALVVQGCVSYSSPAYDYTYSTGDDAGEALGYYGDEYDEVAPNLDIGVADAAFYPWWSVDYYYLGHHRYRPGYWGRPGYSFGAMYGVPPGFWPYYSFYSPFYYPYSTDAWYSPWYGWPRYGIGTNFFYHQVYWVTRNRHVSQPQEPRRDGGSNGIGPTDDHSEFGNAFYDPRDRAPAAPVAARRVSSPPYSITPSDSMTVRSRSHPKIRPSRTGTPSAGSLSRSNMPRTISTTPSGPVTGATSARPRMSSPRPPSARPSATPGSSAGSKYNQGRQRNN